MSSQVEQDLIVRAAVLARTSPDLWKQFVGALAAYSGQQATNCVQSPLDSLPVMQGRAQASARLHTLLADCVSSADKIEGKRK